MNTYVNEQARDKQTLPLVIGVLGDFKGAWRNPTASLRERAFIEVDDTNFDVVMSSLKPAANVRVQNTLANDETEMAVSLEFRCMEDFSPAAIVRQVPALHQLLEVREKLNSLRERVKQSPELREKLTEIFTDSDQLAKLEREIRGDG